MTERRNHYERLRKAELEALIDAMPAIVWIAHDPDCRTITGNRAANRFLRLEAGQNASRSAPAGQAPRHFRVLKDGHELRPEELPVQLAARGIDVRDFEHEVVFDDGSSSILLGNATPIFDEDGKPRGAVAAFIDVTAQRAAAREVQRQQRLFQSLTERLPNVITRVGADGRYLYVSPALSAITGRPTEYYVGKTLEESGWPAEICAKLRHGREQAFKTGKPQVVEFEYTSPKGRHGRHQHTVVPEFAPDGTVESLLTVAVDLTPQMETEQRLKASAAELERQKRLFQSLTEHLPHVVARLDIAGRILYVSPIVKVITGLEPADIIGKTAPEAGFPPDFCRLVQEKLEECIRTRSQVFVEAKFPAVDGVRDFAHIGVPEFAPDGSVESVLTVSMDVTQQKEAERAIRESADRLRHAQKIANMGSYDWDLIADEGVYSDQFCTIFGVDQETFRSHQPIDFIPANEHAKIHRAFDEMLVTGVPYRVEHTILLPDGRVRHVVSQGEIVARDAAGKPTRILGTVLDVTERRRAEEELSKVQKLESLGLMAGGIAHDFNNLLTAIFGNVFLARLHAEARPAENAQVIDALDQAESAFKRASDLAQQLLTFSKGGAPVRKTRAIGRLLQDSVNFMLRGSSVRPELHIEPELWPAKVDEGQLGQAINNIVINAAQAGATRLCVGARNVLLGADDTYSLPPGKYIEIRFEDNGAGIGEAHLGKLFDPYFTTKPGGTGLGLPTTYSIIKRHEGKITVDSIFGKGTCFTIYLPASDETVIPATGETEAVRQGQGRALLMDDEGPVREVGKALLQKLGYEVELAASGEEAIALFEAAIRRGEPFSVAVLDLTVPGAMGGKECVERLRAIDPQVKAVVSSGYFNDPVMAHHEQYGFQGRVPKPYRLLDLSRALAGAQGMAPAQPGNRRAEK